MKRSIKKVCACGSDKCQKKFYKCWKCMLCLWVCKPCRHWKEDRDQEDINDEDNYHLDVKMKFNLKGNKLKNFFKENLLVFLNQNGTIGYISLNNKDRIQEPGAVEIKFDYKPENLENKYIIRMLRYGKDGTDQTLKLTVHKDEDTSDCAKLEFNYNPIVLKAADLERFLKNNLTIKLKDKVSRIKEIELKNEDEMFGQIYYIKRIQA
jgi:hypothetical protein